MAGVLVALGCRVPPVAGVPASAVPDAEPSALTLRLLDVVVLPQSLRTPADGRPRFGSVSGLAHDTQAGRWIGAIDERAQSRLVWFDVSAGPAGLTVAPGSLLPLSAAVAPGIRDDADAASAARGDGARGPGDVTRADLEALVVLDDGSWLVADEGYRDLRERRQPALLHVQRNGEVTGAVRFPPHVQIPDDDTARGVRSNLGVEALTRLPNGHVLAGLEQPLRQDGEVTSPTDGGVVRLVEFAPGDTRADAGTGSMAGWHAVREYAYRLEPTPQRPGETLCQDGANGLVELLAIDASTALTLERSCQMDAATSAARNAVRIFATSLADATDVRDRVSLRADPPARLVRKQLVLDVDTLVPRLPPALARLDNFEALAFGPPVPGTRAGRSVLVMSDDNFRATQHTALLWFALETAPAGRRGQRRGVDAASGVATKR